MKTPNWLAISVTTAADGARVVHLSGELDLATAPQVTEVLIATIQSGGVSDVVLDLDALSFLDAAGLTALLGAHHLAHRSGRTLRARNAHGEVDTVLWLTEIAGLLQISGLPASAEDRPAADTHRATP